MKRSNLASLYVLYVAIALILLVLFATGCTSGAPITCEKPSAEYQRAANAQSFYDFLVRLQLPGLIIRGSEVIYRGQRPVFDIDGTLTRDASFLNAYDVVKVDVLSVSESALYGTRGYGGVIKVTTRRC